MRPYSIRRCIAIPFGLAGAAMSLGCIGDVLGFKVVASGAPGDCGDVYLEAVENAVTLSLDSTVVGQPTGIRLEAFFPDHLATPILKSRRVVIRAPKEFQFQGFEALGQDAEVGRMEFDFANPDGVFEENQIGATIPFFASGPTTAYTDNKFNGIFDSGIDPTVSFTEELSGELVFDFQLPEGGANNGTACHYFAFDARYTLLTGLILLPDTPGIYQFEVAATSVDPDTGNDDDSSGTAPSSFQKSFLIVVPEPETPLLAVAALFVLAALRRGRKD